MTATTADIRSASEILGNNPQLAAQAGSAPSVTVFSVVDDVVDTARFIADGTINPFYDWIAQALATTQEFLTAFTGSSDAIMEHAQNLDQVAAVVERQSPAIEAVRGRVQDCWSGQASDAFGSTMTATASAATATSGLLKFASSAHRCLLGLLAAAKQGVIDLVSQLGTDLVVAIARFLAEMGLALANGILTVVSGTMQSAWKGGLRGARAGALLGPIGMVSGFIGGSISGGVSGFADSADAIPTLLKQAFQNYVAWASGHVSTVLGQIADFAEQSIRPMVAVIGQISGAGVRAERAASLLSGRGDPGTNVDAPAQGTFGQTAQGSGAQKLDGDLIDLNQAVGNKDAQLPEGYQRVSDQELAQLGLTPEMLTDENGFIAEVFKTPDGNYVMAFGGTFVGPGGGKPDIIEDGVGAATVSPQTKQVLAITEALKNKGVSDKFVFTGHSLGGRLAAIASMDTGNAGVTYNAAGVSQATIDYVAHKNGVDPGTLVAQANNGQVRRYYTGDDPLTAAQERWQGSAAAAPDAVGAPIQLGPTEQSDLTKPPFNLDPYREGHYQEQVEQAWRKQYGGG